MTGLTLHTARDEVNAARGAALAAGIAAQVIDRSAHAWFAADHLAARTAAPEAATYAAYRPLAESYDALVEQLIPDLPQAQELAPTTRTREPMT